VSLSSGGLLAVTLASGLEYFFVSFLILDTHWLSVSARFDGEAIKVNDGDGASRGKRPGDGHHGC